MNVPTTRSPRAEAALDFLSVEDCFAPHRAVPSDLVVDGGGAPRPDVTIAIPTFRRPDLLREAIASALQQRTGLDFEVIVVDNESEPEGVRAVDEVVRAFRSPRLRLYRNRQNIGMFGNWNRCIELARARWVSILNDDDLLLPDWLDSVAGPRADAQMRACRVELFGDQDWLARRSALDTLLKGLGERVAGRSGEYRVSPADLLAGNPVHASLGVLVQRDAALALGGYNEKFWPIADYVFSVRYGLRHGIAVTDRRLARYRFSRNESLKLATMALSVRRGFEFRRDLIAHFGAGGWRASILGWTNQRQAWMDAFDWHLRSTEFDWRGVLAELDVEHGNGGPGRGVKALVKLGWLAARPLRRMPDRQTAGAGD